MRRCLWPADRGIRGERGVRVEGKVGKDSEDCGELGESLVPFIPLTDGIATDEVRRCPPKDGDGEMGRDSLRSWSWVCDGGECEL